MAVTVTHPFVSAVVDDGNPDEVGPNEWNAAHTVVGLGTAAEANVVDFATAAQGAKADTALQAADIANMLETGDIGVLVQAYDVDLTAWAGVNPSSYSTTAQIAAGYQPLDADLTAWAAVNPSSYSTTAQIVAAYQPLDADLTTWASLTPSANAQSLVTAANYAAMRALLDLEAGTDFYSISAADAAFQPKDADLTSWAGVTRASGFDTFVATPTSVNLKALLTDETGSGALVFATSPTLVTPALGTPTALVLTNATGLTTSGVAAATLVTASETIGSNNNDTTIPTSAAVKAYADSVGSSSMTLLGTLTTTSGTTQSLTGIAAGYRKFYIEIDGVSFTTAVGLKVALSSTNGAAYGTSANIAAPLTVATDVVNGWAEIGNVSSTIAGAKIVYPVTNMTNGTTIFSSSAIVATNTAAVADAIQFSGGTFDAGTIRVYGVK